MLRALALFCGLLVPPVATAHPHIFVETQLGLVMDSEGRLTAVRVSWTYDELYSLLIFEDKGLDSDYDGQLTEAEMAVLDGFDMNWIPGYEGDIYLSQGNALPLGPPQPAGTLVEQGRIVTTHLRPLIDPVALEAPIEVAAYDPTYYTAYEVTGNVAVEGREDCTAEIEKADLNAAYDMLEELLFGRPQAELEMNFPEVGEAFADKVLLKCPAGS